MGFCRYQVLNSLPMIQGGLASSSIQKIIYPCFLNCQVKSISVQKVKNFFHTQVQNFDAFDDVLGFRVYTGEQRKQAIKFCGWTDYSKPSFASPQQPSILNRGGIPSNPANPQSQIIQHNNQVAEDLKEIFAEYERFEGHVPGMHARNCIIAAMHFDFHSALTQSNFADPQLNTEKRQLTFKIFLILNNILKNLKEIKNSPVSEQQLREKLQQLLGFTKGLKDQMKNPYFKAFFSFLERQQQAMLSFEDQRINFFDYIAVLCRFYNQKDLQDKLQNIIVKGIDEGNLEAIALVGLRSPLVPYILQAFVDNTGDIQTAAYISTYQYVALQAMGIAKVKTTSGEAVLKRLMFEYRQFLNHLQLWYIRADFDVAFSTLYKNQIFQVPTRQSFELEQIQEDGQQDDQRQYLPSQQVSAQLKYGFTHDPTDKKPFEQSPRCFYCQSSFSIESQVKNFMNSGKALNLNQQNVKMITRTCQCGKMIPGCAVCLNPIGVINYQMELQKTKSIDQKLGMQGATHMSSQMRRDIEMWFIWCQECKHGGHAQHILEWFLKDNHSECPVSDCPCQCMHRMSE